MMYQWPPHLLRQFWMQNPEMFGAPSQGGKRRNGGGAIKPPSANPRGPTTGVTQNAFMNPKGLFGGKGGM
jgi:hypothetical protein